MSQSSNDSALSSAYYSKLVTDVDSLIRDMNKMFGYMNYLKDFNSEQLMKMLPEIQQDLKDNSINKMFER